MLLTNKQIYNYTNILTPIFEELKQAKLPVKVSFYLQKNKNALLNLAQEIEIARIDIMQKKGIISESGTEYVFNNNQDREETIKELNDLFNLEQEVNIYQIALNDFGDNIYLTMEQMEAIMFMIE